MDEVKIQMNRQGAIIHNLGFGNMGRVQRFTDETIAREMDHFVPMKSGALKNSVQASVFGSGKLVYNTPYAKAQFYKGREVDGESRGRLWSYRYSRIYSARLLKQIQRFVNGG